MALQRGIRAGRAYVELFADDSRLVRGLKRAQRRLRMFGASVTAIGRKMIRFAAVVAIPFVLGIREAAKFEEQLARVATMVDEPAKHMDRFADALRAMSVEFGESTATLADGLYDILSAQIPVNEALAVLREGTKSAVAGFTDVKTSVSALITLYQAYGDQLDSVADASDLLFGIVKRGRLTYADLAANLGKVAPIAAAAGVSVEDFGAALALITRGQPEVAKATTALANIIETFLKNTDQAKAVARELGIEMSTAGLRSQGLLYVIRQLAKVDPDTVARVFPRRRALRGLIIAIKKVEELGVDIDVMTRRAGLSQVAFEKMADTPMRNFKRLIQTLRATWREIGYAVESGTKRALKYTRRVVELLGEWIAKNKGLVASIGKFVVLIGAAGIALVVFGTTVRIIAFAFGGLLRIMKIVHGALVLLKLGFALLLSPIGLVVAAVVLLGLYLLHVTGAGAKVLSWLGEKFKGLRDDAATAFRGIRDALKSGDFALAAKILWLFLKVEWVRGTGALLRIWARFWHGMQIIGEKSCHYIAVAWHALIFGLKDLWTHFYSFWRSMQIDLAAGMEKLWHHLTAKTPEELAFKLKAVDESTRAAQAALKAEKKARLDVLNAEYRAAEAMEDARHAHALKTLDKEHIAKVKAAAEELAAARKALGAARIEALLGAEGKPGGPPEPGDFEGRLNALIQGMQGQISGAVQAATVAGTFQATATWGMGMGSAAERTARATEQTALNTEEIMNKLEDAGIEFGA